MVQLVQTTFIPNCHTAFAEMAPGLAQRKRNISSASLNIILTRKTFRKIFAVLTCKIGLKSWLIDNSAGKLVWMLGEKSITPQPTTVLNCPQAAPHPENFLAEDG